MLLLDGMVHGEILDEFYANAAELLGSGMGFREGVRDASGVDGAPGCAEVFVLGVCAGVSMGTGLAVR